MSEEIMLTEQQQAEALHKQITGYGEVIYQSLYGMCTAIKQMRDSKLYKALGFDTFEAYTEEKLGMKRRQAYNYIQIADQLTEDFVQPVAQIGMRKLLMLTALTDDQREEIAESVDLSTVTVKQLRQEIYALKEKALDERQDSLKQLQEKQAQIGELMDERAAARKKIKALETQVKELESKPQDVAVVDHTEEMDALKTEIESLKQQLAEKPDTQLSLGVEPVYQTDSKALFKPYLTAAADAVNRLAEFIGQHASDPNYDFFIAKMQAAFDFAKQKITMMKGE